MANTVASASVTSKRTYRSLGWQEALSTFRAEHLRASLRALVLGPCSDFGGVCSVGPVWCMVYDGFLVGWTTAQSAVRSLGATTPISTSKQGLKDLSPDPPDWPRSTWHHAVGGSMCQQQVCEIAT